EPVELHARIAMEEFGQRAPIARVDVDPRMFVGGVRFENFPAKLGLEDLNDLLAGHANVPGSRVALLDLTERPGKYKRRETWSPYLVPDRTRVNELRWCRHSCLLRVEVLLGTSSLRARFRRR